MRSLVWKNALCDSQKSRGLHWGQAEIGILTLSCTKGSLDMAVA